MSEQFYNPYQFIPVAQCKDEALTEFNPEKDSGSLDRSDNKFVRHDYWNKEGLSGRIRCTLETLSPVVVGAKQLEGRKENQTPGEVMPFQLPRHGYAIPANSLRGMIGSVAEVLSHSSLRVLTPSAEGDFSVRKPVNSALKKLGILLKEEGGYWIYPVADLACKDLYVSKVEYKSNKKFLNEHSCYQHEHNNGLVSWNGQQGILSIRGVAIKSADANNGKFIPWNGVLDTANRVSVSTEKVEAFERMLKSLYAEKKKNETESTLWPKGYIETFGRVDSDGVQQVVMSGDLLYYDVKSNEVNELSYSSIWRRSVRGDLAAAFEASADKNILPWSPKRDQLTPVEAMFGVVEEMAESKNDETARNLASRIRFSDATSESIVELDNEVTLKVLNSPKPPSPAMYFSAQGGQYVAKKDLDLNKHRPNGRKHYIPHAKNTHAWSHDLSISDDNNHMRLNCRPIKKGCQFIFNVHFENLSEEELGLLRIALQPAEETGEFTHRLGLGKPLGLGHVSIISAEVETIDRQARYTLDRFSTKQRYTAYVEPINLDLVDVDVSQSALLKLADRASYNEALPVIYPYSKVQRQTAANEAEGFKWFGDNDRQGGRKDFLHRTSGDKNAANEVMKPLSSTSRRHTE